METGRPKSHTGNYNIKRRFSKGFSSRSPVPSSPKRSRRILNLDPVPVDDDDDDAESVSDNNDSDTSVLQILSDSEPPTFTIERPSYMNEESSFCDVDFATLINEKYYVDKMDLIPRILNLKGWAVAMFRHRNAMKTTHLKSIECYCDWKPIEGLENSKKTMMIFSSKIEDMEADFEDSSNSTPHRSCSLNALHTGQVLLQPRMAQLETLEAKMARIENSLSTTPRKKKISSSNNSITSAITSNTNLSLSGLAENIHSSLYDAKSNTLKPMSPYPKIPANGNNTLIYKTSRDIAREMEALKNALRDKENVIDNLKGQLNTSLNVSRLSTTYLQSKQRNDNYDKQAAEDRLQRLKQEMENKSMIIKNIKLELERLDITDNIDVRIQQAELEYQLGREELNLLSIYEEIQSLKNISEQHDNSNQSKENTLFNYILRKHSVTLHAIELVYDPKSPRFGTTIFPDCNIIGVEWCTDDSNLNKGDLLLEINGKLTLGLRNREDIVRLLSISSNPAQIVIMRQHKTNSVVSTLQEELDAYREKAGEAERIRDSFRSDNVRLTHRISYLEEQVAELLSRVSESDALHTKHHSDNNTGEPQIQIFQKGSKVTLIGNVSPKKNTLKLRDVLPTGTQKVRSKSVCKSLDGLSNKDEQRSRISESMSSLPPDRKGAVASQVHVKQPHNRNRSLCYLDYHSPNNSKNKENYCIMNERRVKHLKEDHTHFLNNSIEMVNRRYTDDRSCKSVDFDSEPNYQSVKQFTNSRLKMYDSETSSDYSKVIKYPCPIPPQKPLRLSLHKGCSLQSVKIIDKSNGNIVTTKKSANRSQNSETASESNLDCKTEKWC